MAANTVRIRATLVDKVSGSLAKIRGDFDRLGKNKGAQSLLQGVGVGAGISAFNLLGTAASAAVGGINAAIDAASDLRETTTLTNQVFRENADEMMAWADGASDAFGQSKREALDFAANFGNAFVNVGLALDESSDKAREMTELAADLGSAFNAGADEAAVALRAGLLGESEPLRRFGVFLSEAATKAKALELGIAKAGDTLTDAQKVTARYAIILEDTAAIQGTFGSDTDSLADAQKELAARTENLAAQIGEGLVPVLADVVQQTSDFVDGLGELGQAMDETTLFGEDLNRWVEGFGNVLGTLGNATIFGVISNFGKFQESMDDTAATTETATGKMRDDLTVTKGAVNGLGDAVEDMDREFKLHTPSAAEAFKDLKDDIVDAAGEAIDKAFDPMTAKLELLSDTAEAAAQRRILASDSASRAEKQDAAETLNSTYKDIAENLVVLAEAGQTGTQAYADGLTNLRRAIKDAKGPAKAALQEVYDWILKVENAGKIVPINIRVGMNSGNIGLGGARAGGGPVEANKAYLGGEDGPELFVPSSSGGIVPNGGSGGPTSWGGGGGMTVNFNTVWPPTREQMHDIITALDKAQYSSVRDSAAFDGRV